MDLSKSYEFFKPESVDARIHILGCGSVGSTLAELLVRCGLTKLTLWDFDHVEPHNISNQMFRNKDIGRLKVEALKDLLVEINPEAADDIVLKPDGWQGRMLSGYLFLCVDNIDLRRQIVEQHMDNPNVRAVFDFRTLLTSAQHYAAEWENDKQKKGLLNSMQFSHDEAKAETPVSACGVTLGVVTTVRSICELGINNFLNFVKGQGIKTYVEFDGFNFSMLAFPMEDE